MFQEVIVTSAARGIKAGRTGFQAVAASQGIRDDVVVAAERLSVFRHIFPQGSGKNPVVYTHRILQTSLGPTHFLARTIDAGSDYTGRSNKLTHVFIASEAGLSSYRASTPAALMLANAGRFVGAWNGGSGSRGTGVELTNPAVRAGVCDAWKKVTGDAAWAAVVASRAKSQLKTYVVAPTASPETSESALKLFAEVLALMPVSQRWSIAFDTTYFGSGECILLGTYQSSPEMQSQDPTALYIDLSTGRPAPLAGVSPELIAVARNGQAERAATRAAVVPGSHSKRLSPPPPPSSGGQEGARLPSNGQSLVRRSASNGQQGNRDDGVSITQYVTAAFAFACVLVLAAVMALIFAPSVVNSPTVAPASQDPSRSDASRQAEIEKLEKQIGETVGMPAEGDVSKWPLVAQLDRVEGIDVAVGLTEANLASLRPSVHLLGNPLGKPQAKIEGVTFERQGDALVLVTRAPEDTPDFVWISLDKRKPIKRWLNERAYQVELDHLHEQFKKDDEHELERAASEPIGLSSEERKIIVSGGKTLFSLAQPGASITEIQVLSLNESSLQINKNDEGGMPTWKLLYNAGDGKQGLSLSLKQKKDATEQSFFIEDISPAQEISNKSLDDFRNSVSDARLAVSVAAPPGPQGGEPFSKKIDIWFSEDGRKALKKKEEDESQRIEEDKTAKKQRQLAMKAKEDAEKIFKEIVSQIDRSIGEIRWEPGQEIRLADGYDEQLSLVLNCEEGLGLKCEAVDESNKWSFYAANKPIADAACSNDNGFVIKLPRDQADMARIAFSNLTLVLNATPDWGEAFDKPSTPQSHSFRLASPVTITWQNRITPSKLVETGSASIQADIGPLAAGLVDLADRNDPSLKIDLVYEVEVPAGPNVAGSFSIAGTAGDHGDVDRPQPVLQLSPRYEGEQQTFWYFDLQENTPDNASTGVNALTRQEGKKWKWVDKFLVNKPDFRKMPVKLLRPSPIPVRWTITPNNDIQVGRMSVGFEGQPIQRRLGNPNVDRLRKDKSREGGIPGELGAYVSQVFEEDEISTKREGTQLCQSWVDDNFVFLKEGKVSLEAAQINFIKELAFEEWIRGPIYLRALRHAGVNEEVNLNDYAAPPPEPTEKSTKNYEAWQEDVKQWEAETIQKPVVEEMHANLSRKCQQDLGQSADDGGDKAVKFFAVVNSLDYYVTHWERVSADLDRSGASFRLRVVCRDSEGKEAVQLLLISTVINDQ